MSAVGDLKATAIAAGFNPEREYEGYSVEVLSYFVLKDEKLWTEVERNWALEIVSCKEHSHPDDVLMATLASLSETERAALRLRVKYALEKWDGEA
jgi:hypothetical protein